MPIYAAVIDKIDLHVNIHVWWERNLLFNIGKNISKLNNFNDLWFLYPFGLISLVVYRSYAYVSQISSFFSLHKIYLHAWNMRPNWFLLAFNDFIRIYDVQSDKEMKMNSRNNNIHNNNTNYNEREKERDRMSITNNNNNDNKWTEFPNHVPHSFLFFISVFSFNWHCIESLFVRSLNIRKVVEIKRLHICKYAIWQVMHEKETIGHRYKY